MLVGYSPSESAGNEIDLLIEVGNEIEHKFDIGRADDIQPPQIRCILSASIVKRKETSDADLQNALMEIEDSCYAILDNSRRSEYYRNLRILARQLISLQVFT